MLHALDLQWQLPIYPARAREKTELWICLAYAIPSGIVGTILWEASLLAGGDVLAVLHVHVPS